MSVVGIVVVFGFIVFVFGVKGEFKLCVVCFMIGGELCVFCDVLGCWLMLVKIM